MFYCENGETLQKVSQRGGRCPTPGNLHGQAGQGSEQSNLVEDFPALARFPLQSVGLDEL